VKARWESKALSEVCQFINRGISPAYVNTGGVAVLNQKCVRDHAVNFDLGRRHDTAVKKVSPERLLRAGDVLVNSTGTGTLRRVAQLRLGPSEPTTVDSHVTIVRPAPGLFHPEFFGYALVSIEGQIQAGGEGCGGQTELSRSKLAEGYRISFPTSQDEQRRIVAILDEAFEGIATAKAHAERNLRNARATFESILEAVYTDRVGEAPKERLEALCEQGRLITYGVIKLGDPIEGGVPCLRTSNVRWLSIDTNGMKRIAPSLSAEYSRTVLRGGEVLVNVRGTLGGVAVAPDFMAGWNVSREVAVVPINPVTLDPEYAAFWIGSRASQDWLSGVKKGAAYTGINIEDLRNLPVPVTSHDAQSQIVHDLKAARSATLQIETIYSRKLAALDELKQSLLHQAFSGQL
jgi:type I restriction enzyme S subunit